MATRCFGRRGFATGMALSGLRDVDLATIFGAGDFFCAVVRTAALEVGFCLAINRLPFCYGRRLAQFGLRRVGKGALAPCPPFTRPLETLWWARRKCAFCPPYGSELGAQCSRNTPSTARSSAGLISLECTTVTANSGPSSLVSQKVRKSFSAGKFGNS